MDKNNDMSITKEEFLTSYIDTESKLKDSIKEMQRYIATQTKHMEDSRR